MADAVADPAFGAIENLAKRRKDHAEQFLRRGKLKAKAVHGDNVVSPQGDIHVVSVITMLKCPFQRANPVIKEVQT